MNKFRRNGFIEYDRAGHMTVSNALFEVTELISQTNYHRSYPHIIGI